MTSLSTPDFLSPSSFSSGRVDLFQPCLPLIVSGGFVGEDGVRQGVFNWFVADVASQPTFWNYQDTLSSHFPPSVDEEDFDRNGFRIFWELVFLTAEVGDTLASPELELPVEASQPMAVEPQTVEVPQPMVEALQPVEEIRTSQVNVETEEVEHPLPKPEPISEKRTASRHEMPVLKQLVLEQTRLLKPSLPHLRDYDPQGFAKVATCQFTTQSERSDSLIISV